MEDQKTLNLLYEPSDINLSPENETLSIINQMQVMMQEMKLSITQKY